MAFEPMDYLKKNELLHIDMIENLRAGRARLVAAGPKGVLLDVRRMYLISAEDEAAARGLCQGEEIHTAFAHQACYLGFLQRQYGLGQLMACHQIAWFGPPPPMPETDIEIRPLGPKWLPQVQRYYDIPMSADYLRDQLDKGVVSGAFVKGELAGFVGEHSEGSMGMLEVLPAYRRHGVGRALGIYSIRRYLAAGRVPFAQVDVNNAASLAMQRSMGFTISGETLYFMGKNS